MKPTAGAINAYKGWQKSSLYFSLLATLEILLSDFGLTHTYFKMAPIGEKLDSSTDFVEENEDGEENLWSQCFIIFNPPVCKLMTCLGCGIYLSTSTEDIQTSECCQSLQ